MVLMVGSVVLYYIPVRYLVMMWGVNKFSRKLLRPHSMVNNEVLDFLSRVPDDELLVRVQEESIVNVFNSEMFLHGGSKS